MYLVTYKNKLKNGKNLKDFQKWLKAFWTIQKTWGAQTVHFWSEEEGEDNIVICEYLVRDIKQWNRRAISFAASSFIRDLEEITETNRITVSKITGSRSKMANPQKLPQSN